MDGNAKTGLRIRVVTESGKEVYAASGIKDMQNVDPSLFLPQPGQGDGSGWGVKLTSASGRIMIIDRFGTKTIDPPGVPVQDFVDGLTPAAQLPQSPFGGKCGYMDRNHLMKIPAAFVACQGFSDGMAAVVRDRAYGYINTAGEMKIAPQFDRACAFTEGRARVLVNGAWSVIDSTGKVLFKNQRTGCTPYSEGLMPAHESGKLGFVDPAGTFVIPAKYGRSTQFVDGRAFVAFEEHFVLIDKSGTQIRTVELSDAEDFEHGLARAKQGLLWGLMDTQGRWAVEPKYHAIGPLVSGLRAATERGRSPDFLDERGVRVTPPAPYCQDYRHGVFLCVKDPHQGGVDLLNPLKKPRNVIDYITRDGTRIGGIDLTGFLPEGRQ